MCSRVIAGARHAQRHDVLQLIAIAVGAARLVKGRATPNAAAQGLVQEPAVQQHIHGPIGRLAPGLTPKVLVPEIRHALEAPHRDPRFDSARRAPAAASDELSSPRNSVSSIASPGLKVILVCIAPQGSRPPPTRLRQAGRARSSAAGSASDPWRPMNSARSAVQVCCLPPMSMKATRDLKSVLQGLRASSARDLRFDCGDDERSRPVVLISQHPIHVVSDRQLARLIASVADLQPRNLDRILERHELQSSSSAMPCEVCSRARVAETMPHHVYTEAGSRIGSGVALHRSPDSSSRM